MTAYTVTARYAVNGEEMSTFDTIVVAETGEEANRAFRAVHPDGATFTYTVVAVIPNVTLFA